MSRVKTPAQNASGGRKKLLLLLCALNLLAGLLIYSNTFQSGFHFDGVGSIRDNPLLKEPNPLLKTCENDNLTRCLTHLTFAVNHRLHGISTAGYHAVNLALHIGASLILFWLIVQILQTPRMQGRIKVERIPLIAWGSSLIFLCHPLQTQAVTYIWQRFASLAAFFYFLTLAFYLSARLKAKASFYAFSFLAMILAMFSKETAATLPVMIAVTELVFFDSSPASKKTRTRLFFALGAALLIIPGAVFLSGKLAFYLKPHFYYGFPTAFGLDYFYTQLNVIRTYLRLLVLPFGQNLDYDYPISRSFWELRTALSFALIASLLSAAAIFRSRFRILSWSVFWFFITLSVESSFLPIRDVIFEHRLYLPLAGFAVFSSFLLHKIFRSPKAFTAALLITAAVLSILTYQRNKVWKSEITLWEDVIQKSPHKSRGYSQLCLAWKEAGNFDTAIAYCEKAVALNSQNAVTYNNLGSMYGERRDFEKAAQAFARAISLAEKYSRDRETASRAHNNMGNVYFIQGKRMEALDSYGRAISYDPLNIPAHFNLAKAALKNGNRSLAEAEMNLLFQLNAYELAVKIKTALEEISTGSA